MPAYRRAPKDVRAAAIPFAGALHARSLAWRRQSADTLACGRWQPEDERFAVAFPLLQASKFVTVALYCLELSRIRHHSSSTQTLDAAWANSRCGAALICVLPFREAPAPPARTGAPRGRANIRSTHAAHQQRKNQRRSPFPQ